MIWLAVAALVVSVLNLAVSVFLIVPALYGSDMESEC